jgi:DNA-binding SARP family transcriptional activator
VEGHSVNFAILGPLEAHDIQWHHVIRPFKQRVVLATLLCRANQCVSTVELTDAVWGDGPPRTAHKNLQIYVCAIRKSLPADAMQLPYTPPGYTLRIGPDALDALVFQQLARDGRRAVRGGDAAVAAELLGRALRLWRGPVLPDLVGVPVIAAEARRLEEQYLNTFEDWAEAKLTLGHHAQVLERVDDLARRHPFRERLRSAQMIALYRCGRQTEALAEFDALRRSLGQELGLAPSPVLGRLYEAILVGDTSLALPAVDRLAPRALRTTAGGSSTLTRDVADFTGREPSVRTLLAMLDSTAPPAVTALTGLPGSGKTALAVHCAHRLGARYPDGRVQLAGRDAGVPRPDLELLADMARGLGLTGPLPADPAQLHPLIREATGERRVLFLLDDAAGEHQVRTVVAAAGHAPVLVTCRRFLDGLDAVTHLTVGPMPDEQVLALLRLLVGDDRLAADPAATGRLVAACHGLPLLARTIAAKLNALGHLSVGRYAERLSDGRRLLGDLAQVRGRFRTCYDELSTEERDTVRGLAALDGNAAAGVPAARIAATRGAAPDDTERILERLIEAHLVEVRQPDVEAHDGRGAVHYGLPPLVRTLVDGLWG